MSYETKEVIEEITPGEIIDKAMRDLLQHDASTQGAILDEIRACLISHYSNERDNHSKTASELDHSINILKGNIPTSVAVENNHGGVFVERKNYRD